MNNYRRKTLLLADERTRLSRIRGQTLMYPTVDLEQWIWWTFAEIGILLYFEGILKIQVECPKIKS
jgi:hypothetical protein